MKKLLLLSLLFLASCTSDEIVQEKPAVTLCGQVFTASTIFSTTGTFIGVRYDVVLDTPYFDGTNTWTKAYFIINDAQNTPLVQQYWTNPPSNLCGVVTSSNLYN